MIYFGRLIEYIFIYNRLLVLILVFNYLFSVYFF